MKNIFVSMLVLLLMLFASPVQADRVTNALIGIGAITVGTILLYDYDNQSPYFRDTYRYTPCYRESRVILVPSVRNRVWCPGHYAPTGVWIRSKWMVIINAPVHGCYR